MPVAWRIAPARDAIIEEHTIRRSDLLFLVLNNSLIPQGHEGIVLRGIQAGFHGDWLIAMHLLIPQLEASIREVLQQLGAIPGYALHRGGDVCRFGDLQKHFLQIYLTICRLT